MTPDPVRPGLDEFRALAREHTVVPVWREVLADLETPVSAFVKLVGDGEGFLLESVEHGDRWGRFSFIGRDPALTIVVRGGTVETAGEVPPGVPLDRGALAALEALLERFHGPRLGELPPFHGGVVGYLGYDVVREVEHLPDVPADPVGWPDAVLALTGHVTAFDHFRQRLYLIENVFPAPGASDAELDAAYARAVSRLDDLVDELARPLPYAPSPPPDDQLVEVPPFTTTMGSAQYRRAVEAAKEHILAGDVFQVVLAQRFDLDGVYDPFDVYRVLRQVNPSPYMYFLRHAEATLVGSSPEPMVQVLGGRVISRPIAGTRYRGRSEEHDRRLTAELSEDPKERAEHVMLVNLARNDVGRVVRFGTEQVNELMTLERYSHVMHLTSQVSGDLADGRNAVDVLRATFPAGTVSGAPKVRAMEIIDELEPVKRGPYAGVVGYLDFSGNLDTAITIRTMLWRDEQASVQAGAGIVADSDPELEDLECHNKARALLTAAAASRRLRSLGPQETHRVTILERDLVVVSGDDAFSFLQSLVSQDVEGLDDGAVAASLLLTPKGKIDSWFRLARVGDAAWLDVEAGAGDALAAALARFLLRVKATIGRPDEPWGMVAIRDGGDPEPAPPGGLVIPVPWGGVDVLGPRAALAGIGGRGLDADGYERARIAAGVPRLGPDLDESTIPQEAFLDRDSVSFTKGCFLGQELVARIDSRGHVNRYLRRVDPRDEDLVLAPGGEIEVGGKVVGTVTSAVAGRALGYVRHEVAPPAAGTVNGAQVMVGVLSGRQ